MHTFTKTAKIRRWGNVIASFGRVALCAAAVAGGVLLPMEARADNPSILLNGSFESYVHLSNDVFPDSQTYAGMNSSRYVNNWSRSGCGVCISGDTTFLGGNNAADGSIAVYLQGSDWISQDITIDSAGTYEVSFRYLSRNGNYLNGRLYAKIIDASGVETTIGYVDCPVTIFRTAYMKVYLAAGNYTFMIAHDKGTSTHSGDSIIDRVEMKLMDNLISNGSFEDYRNENNNWTGTYKGFVSGTFVPEAWGYSGNLVLLKADNPYNFTISDGDIAVAVRKNAVLTQEIIAPTTGVYEVSFQYSKRNSSGSVKLFACLDDEELGSVTLTTNTVRTAYFKANLEAGTAYTLSITNNATSDNANTDSGIDLVSVVSSTNLILNGGFDYGTINPYQNGGKYLQSNQAGYINPFWTESGYTGRIGLAVSGSAWIDEALDVGTYALYMQTKNGQTTDDSVRQDFKVNTPGVYRLSFSHAKRNADRADPEVRVRVYYGKGTSGAVAYQKTVSSSRAASGGVFDSFVADVKIPEAGEYTLEFYREANTTADITAIIDHVSLTYFGKIAKGLTIIVR